MSDNLPGEQQSKVDPLKFKKRKGTTDLGKLYEEYFPVFVILKLLQNKEVKDFRISANDDQFGDFDDFILEVDYTNKPTDKYAVQMKHKDNFILDTEKLKKTKGFDVLNYAQAFQKHAQQWTDYKVILFTNAKFRNNNDVMINLQNSEESVTVRTTKCEPSSVINTSNNGESYQFQLQPENSKEIKEKYSDFFDRFSLYTNQMNAHQLGNEIPQLLGGLLTSKDVVCKEFLKFISDWSLQRGIKDKLTKDMMIKVLTLRNIEELMHLHTFCEVNKNQKIVQKTISHFNITAFNTKSLDEVVKIWGDAKSILRDYDIKRINEILRQFQIGTRYIPDIDHLTGEESTKLLWVMDKCPLILKDGPAAYEAATLCGENSKFVFITDDLHDEKLAQLTVFKTLSDLKGHKSTYSDIVKNFTFELFGEKTNFETLIQENADFENSITTNEIAQILDTTDVIKLEEEKLCFPYVERYLYKNIIDFKYLQKFDEKTMVLMSNVSDVEKLKNGLQKFEIVSILDELNEENTSSKKSKHVSNRTKREEEFDSQFERNTQNFREKLQNDTKHKLVFNHTETSLEEFTILCNKNKEYQRFHHLRYHDEYLEWIKSTPDVSDLHNFITRSDSFVNNEEKYAENFSHNVNIVIGDPGMGKSLFLKKLKNNLLSKYLPVIILPTDVPKLYQFIEHRNLQEFFNFILEKKFLKFRNFERQVVKLLMQKRKVVFLWDALDELSEQNRKFVEEFIKTLSENSVMQFVTSRGILRKQLEDKFNVLPQELQPFNNTQQTDYIRRRLQDICSGEELEWITTKINENIAETSYCNILGIPLQIYMLTELFLQDLPKYKKMLCEFFVITDLYFHFIDEKFNFHFKVKRNYPSNYREDEIIEETISRRIKNYQQVAVQSTFGTDFSMESNTDSELFLNKLKEKGDEFGVITAVDMEMNPEFLHNSYAEYFAASYLVENCRRISNLDIIYFDRKYTNVKYFFDSLLAKNSPAHIAVLCKNVKYLRDCSSTGELKSKDLQGRNALHLAASWGERYPLLETSETGNNLIFGPSILINDNINYETREENTKYYQMMEVLLENCDPTEVDELFNFTPTMYAEKSECLFAAGIIGKKIERKSYLTTKSETFIYSLLYYTMKYKFIDIVSLFDNLKFLIITKDENSLLHMTTANNQFEYLRELLKHEVYRRNISYRNSVGDTALMIAAENGYTKTVKYLTQQNAKVDEANKNGFTPLMMAARKGHLDTVKYLIQQNANVNATNSKGQTPLYLAAFHGHFETVEYLKQQNAIVDGADKNGFTPLMGAAYNGHLDTVKYLIQQNANVNAVANEGETPLYLAALNGHLETVKYLKQQNAEVDEADKNGFTPLMNAAENGHLDTVNYLIQQNANVNATNSKGQTPLYLAAFHGHFETVEYLKQQNAKVAVADKNGVTPLMVAAQNGHLDTVKYLIQQNANVNAAANEGQTPLYLAAFEGHLETVKYLKQQNAKVDEADKNGLTPLMVAAQNGRLDTVKYLIQQNANVNAAANEGHTPLFLATLNGHLETVKYLEQQNAKVDKANKNGFTPLMVAAQNGHLDTVKYLIQQNANVNAAANKGQTPFFLAAFHGHFDTVEYLKQQNAKVAVADKNGVTPLMVAAQNGHLDTVKYLIQQNANVNAAANEGQTPLHLAAFEGHLETVKYLKQQNAKVDEADKNSLTPLMVAAQNGRLDTVKYLIQQNANVNAAANEGHTPLFLATLNGYLETVKYLEQQNAKVDKANKNGFTPLMVAARNGHLDTVKYLIQQNANVNAAANEGQTPLHLAALNGHLDTVKYLVQQNANVNAVASEGQTPVHLAALKGHLETVKYLKQQNAKVDKANKNGFTPLMNAAQNGHLDTVKFLIQQNANVNATANEGETPLHLAAYNGHLETVNYLKQQNAEVDEADKYGFTPLMNAAQNGHLDTVKYLIQQNANVNAAANKGQTSLYLAAFSGHLEIVKYLKQRNAKVDKADKDGFTPLMVAAANGHLDTVKYLIQHYANVNAVANKGQTPLHFAALKGHLEIVKYLKQQNAKYDKADKNGFTPLMVAAENGHLEIVKYFIQQNANVNAVSNKNKYSI